MKKSRYTDIQIINVLKQNQAGESVANLCREHGMSQPHSSAKPAIVVQMAL